MTEPHNGNVRADATSTSPAPSQWAQVTALFEAMADLAPDARAAARPTLADDAVWAEVESLLAAHDAADGRFDQPAVMRLSSAELDSLAPPEPFAPATRVGAYEVLRKVGEGGMGAVYEATRADDSYRKRVAIKTIARGADSSTIASRFRRERQILAELQHPNIAALLDGGVTDTGTPYFVMEFVDGLPIDQWCATQRLSVAQRLDLMQQVCRAVQHAHQRLVVHRDLKPQNVLVAADGVVKLLDFGVARLIEPTRDDADAAVSLVTHDGGAPLTAAYASPEQLRGEPVSTTSDVYSLGVMLYELLAGVPPVPRAGRSAREVSEAVLNTDPPAPSDACTTEAAHACREGNRVQLSRRLTGELDAIVLMAMRKEPSRRYASVEALAGDINRYLRGMPITARPDTLSYRTSRFVARNRGAVIAVGTLALLALVSGGIIARQSSVARRETARSARISEFLQGVLGAADATSLGGVVPRVGPRASVGVLLDSAVRRVPAEFADDPAIRARLYLTIGSGLIAQSRMRAAAGILDSAIALAQAAYGERSDLYALANLEGGVAALHANNIPRASALTVTGQRALTAANNIHGELYARALKDLASVALVQNDYPSVARYAREALALEERRTDKPTLVKAVALNRLSVSVVALGNVPLADSLLERSMRMLLQIGAGSNLEMVDVLSNRQTVKRFLGQTASADSLLAAGERIARETFGPASREEALLLAGAVQSALARGDVAAAERASAAAIRIVDSIADVVSAVRAIAHFSAVTVAVARRDWPRADSALRPAFSDLRGLRPGIQSVQLLTVQGALLTNMGDIDGAERALRHAAAAYDSAGLSLPPFRQTIHAEYARVLARRHDEAGVTRELAAFTPAQALQMRAYLKQDVAAASHPKRESKR